MSEHLLDEGLIPVTKAVEAEGVSISSKTALRWCLHGVRGVRLESIKVAGRRITSRAAVRRFICATQASADQRAALDEGAAERVLDAYGLGRQQLSAPDRRRPPR